MQIFSFASLQSCLLIPSVVPNFLKKVENGLAVVIIARVWADGLGSLKLDSSLLAGPQKQLYYLPTKTVALLVLESGCKCS